MNTDIRIHIEFWSHAKTRRMIRALGLQGPVSLQILWCYAAKNRPDGVMAKMDADDIEEAAGWPVERRGEFFMYCSRHGWLDKKGRQWAIHEWVRYNPWAADSPRRAEKNRRAAHERHHVKKNRPRPDICDYCKEDASRNALCIPDALQLDAQSNAPIPETRNREPGTGNLEPEEGVIPVTPPVLPEDGTNAVLVVTRTIEAIAPNLYADEFTVSQWLRDITPDPWWIAAAICESELSLPKARDARYITAILRRRQEEGWTCEDAKGYVEFRLSRKGAVA